MVSPRQEGKMPGEGSPGISVANWPSISAADQAAGGAGGGGGAAAATVAVLGSAW